MIQQPNSQIRFVNLAICRLRTHGKVFMIATFPNTVTSWRNKTETNIDDVLQIREVYENISKAQVAKQADLQKAFGTTDKLEICKIILDKGEVQVAGKEREQQLESLRKEIATGVAERCYNPDSNLPWPVTLIEKALQDIHFSPQANKAVKGQILAAIKQLQEAKTIPIARARMRIRLTMPSKDGKKLKDKIIEKTDSIEEEDWSDEWELVALIDPGQFRVLNEIVSNELRGRGRLETLSFTAVE